MTRIGGTTRVVAVVGDPVSHSRSPAMHNAAFAALRLDFAYVALRVAAGDLPRALAGVRALGLAGLNLTVPHKEAVLPLLDETSPTARAIGAVNTVWRDGERLLGENTDAEGFRTAVRELGFRPRRRTALLLGAGGSARAVAWALAEAGVGRLVVLNRDPSRAERLAADVRAAGAVEVEAGGLDEARDAHRLDGVDLVVNCTSVGLDGRSAPPLSPRATSERCLFYDLVYGAAPTPFVRLARRAGRRAADGRSMLLHQAAAAFRLWTGRRAPVDVMRRALARS